MPELCPVEPDNETRDLLVIEVSERVPGERARIVVMCRNAETGIRCTVIVIYEDDGTWAIHGLGNQGVRISVTDMRALAEAILTRAR